MKVDHPRYRLYGKRRVYCCDCPLDDSGWSELCLTTPCPTDAVSYMAACQLADAAEKEVQP